MLWFRMAFLFVLGTIFFDANGQEARFTTIYSNIINKNCALGGCHDGSFEPNFSSLMSAYNTLVYHPIVKNNREEGFTYRVIPYNHEESVLYERITNCCFVDQDDRMPFYDLEGLSTDHVNLIKDWIDSGAKDIYGNEPVKPNSQVYPLSCHVYRLDPVSNDQRPVLAYSFNSYKEAEGLRIDKNRRYKIEIQLDPTAATYPQQVLLSSLYIVSENHEFTRLQALTYDTAAYTLSTVINSANFDSNVLYTFQLRNDKISSLNFPLSNTPHLSKLYWSFTVEQ